MEHKPNDTLAKLVIRVLAPHREQIAEVELRLPAYGDILLRPGPPLDPATGLLHILVDTRQVLLEFFSGRPSFVELVRIRAKGFMGVVQEHLQKTDFAELEKSAILIIGNGFSRSALRRAFLHCRRETPGRGLHRVIGWPEVWYVDLLRLPVNVHTAWLHVAGKSAWVAQALELLLASENEINRLFLSRLSVEVPHMEIQQDLNEEVANRRFLSAWEAMQYLNKGRAQGRSEGRVEGRSEGRVEGRSEGRVEGRSEGRIEGSRLILKVLLEQRFGAAAEPLVAKLEQISDPGLLENLTVRAVRAATLEELLQDP